MPVDHRFTKKGKLEIDPKLDLVRRAEQAASRYACAIIKSAPIERAKFEIEALEQGLDQAAARFEQGIKEDLEEQARMAELGRMQLEDAKRAALKKAQVEAEQKASMQNPIAKP